VTAVAFSPVERKLATAAEEFGAWLWEVDTGNRVFYPGTETRALSHDVAFSPDGLRVAYGVANNRALVFEIETGALVAELDHKGGLTGNVQALEFSSNGVWLATGSARTGRVWDLDDGTLVTMVRHGGRMQTVVDVAFSPDQGSFATVGQDGVARIWSFPSGDLQKELRHDKALHAIDFSPGGGYVATACQDSKARVWNVRTGELVVEVAHAEPVLDVAFSPDGTQLGSASDTFAYVWAADG
jgi:WD40 repeat protein